MTFFFIFSSLLTCIYIYTGLRLIPSLFNKNAARISWCILIFAMLSLFVHIYLRVNFIYPALSYFCAWVGYIGLGLVSYLFCLAFLRDLIILPPFWIIRIKQLFFPKKSRLSGNKSGFKPDRRSFLLKTTGYSIATLATGAAGFGCAGALQRPKVVNIDIPLTQKHQNLHGLKIVQFTDLHVGPTIRYDYVKPVCDTIMDLNADIIVCTGDLADGSPKSLENDVALLKDLHAPLGKFFVTGNHEYYSGAKRWIKKMKELGFIPLLNEHRQIKYNSGHLTLAGVTDIRAKAFYADHKSSPQKAIQGSPDENFHLLCAHQPTSIYEAAKVGFDLQISGHTHGGQYFPFNYFIMLEHPFVKGMYRYKNTDLYVSQGTGYWGPPLRLGTFPEITLFEFKTEPFNYLLHFSTNFKTDKNYIS